VGDDWRQDAARRAKVALIDTSTPNPARVGDYLYGGPNNFEADRKAARTLIAAAPATIMIAPAARAFHQRVVRYLAGEARVTQFIDIGTSLAVAGRTHEVAQDIDPQARVVYASSDPMVLAHARALMRSTARGAIGFADADVREPDTIIADARTILDFGRPVAVLLLSTLATIADNASACAVVSSLAAAVPSGSYIALYHVASDLDPAMPLAAREWNKMSSQPATLRSQAEITRLLTGLEPVPPGLVPIPEWRPAVTDPRFENLVPVYGVVARKP